MCLHMHLCKLLYAHIYAHTGDVFHTADAEIIEQKVNKFKGKDVQASE